MPSISRIMANGLWFSLAVSRLAASDSELPKATPSNSYSVVYTGRLFGYFRYPEVQVGWLDKPLDAKEASRMAADNTCPEDTNPALFREPMKSFWTLLKSEDLLPLGTSVRVALGDNFAPFLLGRQMAIEGPVSSEERLQSKDLFVWEPLLGYWRRDGDPSSDHQEILGLGQIPMDNVACFLRLMHFDAIVPGKHDFYFGPERLRELARFLASEKTGKYRPVQMLGANLSLNTTRVKPEPPRSTDHPGYKIPSGDEVTPVLPTVVLPWARKFKIKNALSVKKIIGDRDQEIDNQYFDPLLGEARPDGPPDPTWDNGKLKEVRLKVGVRERSYSVVFEPNVQSVRVCRAMDVNPRVLADPTDPAKSWLKVDIDKCAVELQPDVNGFGKDGKVGRDVYYYIDGAKNGEEFALTPDWNFAICYKKSSGSDLPFCTPFSVHPPFFEYPWTNDETDEKRLKFRPNGPLAKPEPWKLKQVEGGQKVAIFGIVDPNLRQYIGYVNDTWLRKTRNAGAEPLLDDEYQTRVEVADPVESLQQILQYCDTRDDCRKAHKILLAQMPRPKAVQIASSPKFAHVFDLVIAETDFVHASGEQTLLKTVGDSPDDIDFVAEPFVLVPGAHIQEGTNLVRTRLQRAIVTVVPHRGGTKGEDHLVRNTARRTPAQSLSALDAPKLNLRNPNDADRLFKRISHSKFVNDMSTHPPGLVDLALEVMRRSCHADIAFLQRRDVFLAPDFEGIVDFDTDSKPLGLSKDGFRTALNAIFWKGDLVLCRNATGDTIRKLLDRSKEIESAENNDLFTELEAGRALAYLGITPGPDSIVNGQILDPKKLYSIATTDYLALDDTGYPILQTEEPPPRSRIKGDTKINLLSDLVRNALEIHKPLAYKAGQYLDALDHQAYDRSARLNPSAKFRDWWHNSIRVNDYVPSQDSLERKAQVRRLWYMNLDKIDGGYSLFLHNGTETSVAQNFAGISTPSLSATASSTLSFDYVFRTGKSGKKWDFFAESDLNYTHHAERIRRPDEPYQVSQLANYFFNSAGWARWLHPGHRNSVGLKLVLPASVQTQLVPGLTQFSLKGGGLYPAKTPLSYYVAGRPGIRYENRKSFLEAGYQSGYVLRSPKTYVFSDPIKACDVEASQAVGDCVNPPEPKPPTPIPTPAPTPIDLNSKLQILTRNHFQSGLYLNFRMTMPLPFSTAEYVMENRGDLFFNHRTDASIDTRLTDLWQHTIKVPIYRKLSLAPELDLFFFQNKVRSQLYRSYTSKVSLNYTFDWHQGLGWKKVLGFDNPVPTLRDLPSR